MGTTWTGSAKPVQGSVGYGAEFPFLWKHRPFTTNRGNMSYTVITVSKPGAAFRAASNADEANAIFAQVMGIVAANGGENVMIGFDYAQNANVAITTFPDPESAAKASIQIDAKQLLDVVSRGMFTTMEELWPVFMDALG